MVMIVPFSLSQEVIDTTRQYYSKTSDLCGYSITLYPDSTFVKDSGCESHAKVHFGKYSETDDSLFLSPMKNIIEWLSWEYTESDNEDKVKITIVDDNDEPLSGYRFLTFKIEDSDIEQTYTQSQKNNHGILPLTLAPFGYREDGFDLTIESDIFQYIDLSMGITDNNGEIVLGRKDKNVLEFAWTLQYGTPVSMDLNKLKGRDILLKFHAPPYAFNYRDWVWQKWNEPLVFRKEAGVILNEANYSEYIL